MPVEINNLSQIKRNASKVLFYLLNNKTTHTMGNEYDRSAPYIQIFQALAFSVFEIKQKIFGKIED